MNNRINDFLEVLRHKRAFLNIRKSNYALKRNIPLFNALMHDTCKAINILIFGDTVATKLHRKFAKHHKYKTMSAKRKWESFCDWECARYTKPKKQQTGTDYALNHHSEMHMKLICELFAYFQNKPVNKSCEKEYQLIYKKLQTEKLLSGNQKDAFMISD